MERKEIIYRLALEDPTVRSCISLFESGALSFDEAMMEAVRVLAQQKREAIDLLIEYEKNRIPTRIVGGA